MTPEIGDAFLSAVSAEYKEYNSAKGFLNSTWVIDTDVINDPESVQFEEAYISNGTDDITLSSDDPNVNFSVDSDGTVTLTYSGSLPDEGWTVYLTAAYEYEGTTYYSSAECEVEIPFT